MSTKGKYPQVTLFRSDGTWYQARVHDLVLTAFVGPRPEGMECCHYPDRTPANCALSNLRWDTRKGNRADSDKHGTLVHGERAACSIVTTELVAQIRQAAASGELHTSIATRLCLKRRHVTKIVNGGSWNRAGGPLSRSRQLRRTGESGSVAAVVLKLLQERGDEPVRSEEDEANA